MAVFPSGCFVEEIEFTLDPLCVSFYDEEASVVWSFFAWVSWVVAWVSVVGSSSMFGVASDSCWGGVVAGICSVVVIRASIAGASVSVCISWWRSFARVTASHVRSPFRAEALSVMFSSVFFSPLFSSVCLGVVRGGGVG